jgi:hypothetical protein
MVLLEFRRADMCELEKFDGGCNDCPYETGSIICKKGRIEIHRLFLYGPEESQSKYDKAVERKRKAAIKEQEEST